MKTVIITSPHPDDAVLGCGGTIIKSIQENTQVYVIYLTDGRACYTYLKIKSNLTPSDVAAGRKKEAIESCRILGVPESNLKFLEIWDRELGKPKNFKKALAAVKELVRKTNPYRIFGPVFKNRHIDHQATHDIILEVLKDCPDIEFYMYGLQKSIGKSDLKIDITSVREQRAKAMFIHEIELVYERDIYKILAKQTKERFRLYRRSN